MSDATSTNPLLANYEFHKDSERAIVYYLCTSPTFWHAGGQHLLPNLMGPPESKLLTAAVREIIKETRVPPKHYAVVLQRLHTQSLEGGRISPLDLAKCHAYVGDIDSDDLPDEQAILREVMPTIQRQLRQVGSNAMIDSVTKSGEEAEEGQARARLALEAIDKLGKSAAMAGTPIGKRMLDGVLAYANAPRLSTGVSELDLIFGGGPKFGELGMLVGNASEGKSTAAAQLHFSAGLKQNLFCGYATLEIYEAEFMLRLASELSAVPKDAIARGGEAYAEAERRIAWLIDEKRLGIGRVKEFPATITTLDDIFAWVEEEERIIGRPMDVLTIDADEHVDYTKLGNKKDLNDYAGMGKLYAYGRGWCTRPKAKNGSSGMFISQSKDDERCNKEGYIKKHTDAADSKRKGRVSDWCITINCRGPGKSLTVLNVPRGRSHPVGMTSELETNFACAQIVKVEDHTLPWIRDRRVWSDPNQVEIDLTNLRNDGAKILQFPPKDR